jgi:pSer/pThr/pTyr-binding forkhead associated (FHA) protein
VSISYQTNALTQDMVDKIESLDGDQLSDTVKVNELGNDAQGNSSLFHPDMELILEIEGISQTLQIQPKENHEYIIGRHDPEGGYMPEIDLLPFGGYRMGISRRHAAITLLGKRLNIRDLGSSNGTSLNGNKLDKHEAHQLRDGDKLRMGNLTFRIRFIR